MTIAIYAGSFDPWSFGHQYVLNAALKVFEKVHILSAINPLKNGSFSAMERARLIAHSINPLINWWILKPPFNVLEKVIVTFTEGLVADYAKKNNIYNFIRGLRSTSDFEAEFNLYFANYVINANIQTWCILCPPELLHCSSTFVKSVIGKTNNIIVGTSFVAQALWLKKPKNYAYLLDIIYYLSKNRFNYEKSDLKDTDLNMALHTVFYNLSAIKNVILEEANNNIENLISGFLKNNELFINDILINQKYDEYMIMNIWAILIASLIGKDTKHLNQNKIEEYMFKLSVNLGIQELPLCNLLKINKLLIEKYLK